MTATLMIIRQNKRIACSFTDDLDQLTQTLTEAALRDETLAEAITRAAVEVDIKRQTERELISIVKNQQ